MDVGIIGAGRLGQAMAHVAVRAGRSVAIANSREPASLASVASGLRVRATTAADAAAAAIVVIAVPWDRVPAAVHGIHMRPAASASSSSQATTSKPSPSSPHCSRTRASPPSTSAPSPRAALCNRFTTRSPASTSSDSDGFSPAKRSQRVSRTVRARRLPSCIACTRPSGIALPASTRLAGRRCGLGSNAVQDGRSDASCAAL